MLPILPALQILPILQISPIQPIYQFQIFVNSANPNNSANFVNLTILPILDLISGLEFYIEILKLFNDFFLKTDFQTKFNNFAQISPLRNYFALCVLVI